MKSIFTVLAITFAMSAQAASIEESYNVNKFDASILKILSQNPELSVDHVDSQGFEVYGPKGTGEYLRSLGLNFESMPKIEKSLAADYPTYQQMTSKLQSIATKYPKLVEMKSIGKSVKGKELWVLKISDNVAVDEVEPEFKYISSMHGDEITGRELMVSLIEEMLSKYGKDSEITSLINNTEIFIMPSMNPDGSELRQRGNANNRDLNRNFPDFTRDSASSTNGREIEVQHVMKYQASRKFALSANFHGGTIVANYPWDSTYDLHPFDGMAKDLSLLYADLNPEMTRSSEFSRGITNGAQWYLVNGGMQDWSYFWFNDFQITIELSHQKWPNYNDIPQFYQDNRDSLVAYIKAIHQGAGFKSANKNLSGKVSISGQDGRSLGSYAFSGGEFYKVLPEGRYTFNVSTPSGNQALSINVSTEIEANGRYQQILK